MQGQSTALVTRGHLTVVPAALEPVLDAQNEAARQRRALLKLVQPITELARTCDPGQRPHLRLIVDAVREISDSNRRLAATAYDLAAFADPITSVHQLAKEVRPALGTLINHHASTEQRATAIGDLHRLFPRTNPRTRGALSLRPLLGATKYGVLLEQVAAWNELQTVKEGRTR